MPMTKLTFGASMLKVSLLLALFSCVHFFSRFADPCMYVYDDDGCTVFSAFSSFMVIDSFVALISSFSMCKYNYKHTYTV